MISKIMGLLGELQYILLSVSLSMYSMILLNSNSAMLMPILVRLFLLFLLWKIQNHSDFHEAQIELILYQRKRCKN